MCKKITKVPTGRPQQNLKLCLFVVQAASYSVEEGWSEEGDEQRFDLAPPFHFRCNEDSGIHFFFRNLIFRLFHSASSTDRRKRRDDDDGSDESDSDSDDSDVITRRSVEQQAVVTSSNSSDVILSSLVESRVIFINAFYYGVDTSGNCVDPDPADDECLVNGFSVNAREHLVDCNGEEVCDDVRLPITMTQCQNRPSTSAQFMHVDYQCIDGKKVQLWVGKYPVQNVRTD